MYSEYQKIVFNGICTAKTSSLNVERELTVFSFLLLRQYRIRVDELRKNKYKTLLATE